MKVRSFLAIGITTALLLTACDSAAPADTQSTGGASSQATATVATKQTTPQTTATAAPTPQPTATTATKPQATATTATTPRATATSASKPAAAKSTPAQSASGPEIGEGDVRKMAEAWAAVKSFRMKILMMQDGQTAEGLIEVVRPDRERFKSTSNGQSFEYVRIGQDTYLNMGGQWTKSTGGGTGMTLGADPDEIVNDFNESANEGDKVTKGGTSTVDGAPCQEWVVNSADEDARGTLCIGLADNLPRQFKSADGKTTITFSDWNAPITINPPQ